MSTVSKLPRGLLSALGLQNFGEAPRELAMAYAPTIDVRELFLLDSRETVIFTTQATPVVGSNFFANGAVPAGELWFVWQYFVGATPGAGEAIRLGPSIQYQSVNMPVGFAETIAATQNGRAFAQAPFWASPGSVFGFWAQSLTLAPDVDAAAFVTKLRV